MLNRIQPIVLVGGKSRRFGSDKLRAPLPAQMEERQREAGWRRPEGLRNSDLACTCTPPALQWLVDRPIAALRQVFGPRVALVGHCHPDVAARGDLVIEDRYPGMGPIGGILSALESRPGGDIFVLSGDLPYIKGAAVRCVLQVACVSPAALAVLARAEGSERAEPCVGLYRSGAAGLLRKRLEDHSGRRSLHDLFEDAQIRYAGVEPKLLENANTPSALHRWPAESSRTNEVL